MEEEDEVVANREQWVVAELGCDSIADPAGLDYIHNGFNRRAGGRLLPR
jgi:hypothetical protein